MKTADPVAAVICAAGESLRMGGVKKEYRELGADSLTVLGSALRAFVSVDSVRVIAVAVPANDEDAARKAIPAGLVNSPKPKIIFTEGGKTRQGSVYNALRALIRFDPCYVLIHDGARPWVSSALIERVIAAAQEHGAAVPLLGFADTPKEFDGVFITRHLKRANTGAAQTPQGFQFAQILRAHGKAALEDGEFTDDAEVWGKFCGRVAVVAGETGNRKITFPEDL